MSIPMPPPPPPPAPMKILPLKIENSPANSVQSQKNLEKSSNFDNRAALLEDIAKGVKLKKCITNEGRNVQFLDGNNNDDPSSSACGSKNDIKCGPFPSALHAELTNTLKKRKTSAIDVEATKSGIRTFDPNILNTHVPQPTGLKITHATPNFTVTKKSPEMMKKSEVLMEKPPVKSGFSSKESSPKPVSVDVVDKSAPEKVSPVFKKLQRQLSMSEDREEEPKKGVSSVKETKKEISMTFQPEKSPEMVSPSVKELKKQLSVREFDQERSSPKVKELKKQLSVASTQTEVDQKLEKVEIQLQNSIKDLKKQLSVETQTEKRAEKKDFKARNPQFWSSNVRLFSKKS
ncbi:microtubule-associated protein 1B-like [Culicoides brevitarsis]|uniref:microtubule-associated protein 1B-like n=1 Tax=Culicoides brevitarsis TaxID=469753 RepID=UPI00307B2374